MTPEERDIIARFIARVGGAPSAQGSGSGGFGGASVPAQQTALPPIDQETDRFIGEQFSSHPEARYRITQLAFVQEAALAEAQNRMRQMEQQLQQAQSQAQGSSGGGQGQSRGLFGGLFGGGGSSLSAPPPQPQQYAPPPQASYPPGYQPGMFQQRGSGFLGSALTTAAGVAGGVLAADALTSMFSPHGGFGGGFGGGGFGGGGWGGGGEVVNETVVNNYGDQGGGGSSDPWGGAGTSDPGWSGGDPNAGMDQGGGGDPFGGAGASDPGFDGGGDSGGWDDSGNSDGSF